MIIGGWAWEQKNLKSLLDFLNYFRDEKTCHITYKYSKKIFNELMFPNIEHLPQEDQKKFYSDFVYINDKKVMKYTKPIKNAKTNILFDPFEFLIKN